MSDVVRDALQGLYDAHRSLTPTIVLDAARDPESVLHSRFNWDDQSAAEAWRIDQARTLIQSVKIVIRETPTEMVSVRAFVSIPTDEGMTYMPTADAMQHDWTREAVLRQMRADINALERKYRHLEEFGAALREMAS